MAIAREAALRKEVAVLTHGPGETFKALLQRAIDKALLLTAILSFITHYLLRSYYVPDTV